MITLSQADIDRITDWASETEDSFMSDRGRSRYPGMTYENGIKDVMLLLEGEMTIDQLLEG